MGEMDCYGFENMEIKFIRIVAWTEVRGVDVAPSAETLERPNDACISVHSDR